MSEPQFGPPKQIVSSIYELAPEALEQLAQWLEQRGIRTPVSQIVGYQRERLITFVGSGITQTIADSTETDLAFDTTTADAQKTFDGTSTITLPYNAAYIVSGYVEWAANNTGSRYHTITQNGVTRARDWRAATGTAANVASSTLAAPIIGKKGDTIKHRVFQDSGGNLNVSVGANLWIAVLNVY